MSGAPTTSDRDVRPRHAPAIFLAAMTEANACQEALDWVSARLNTRTCTALFGAYVEDDAAPVGWAVDALRMHRRLHPRLRDRLIDKITGAPDRAMSALQAWKQSRALLTPQQGEALKQHARAHLKRVRKEIDRGDHGALAAGAGLRHRA